MALQKVNRNLLNTGVSDSSDATAITIDSSERVGINQTSPAARLDIKGDTTTYDGMAKIYLTDTSSNSGSRNWSIGNGGSAFGSFTIGCSNAKNGDPQDASGTHFNPLVITNAGNVGIGTNSPNAYSNVTTLTINGTNQGRVDLEYGGTLSGSFLALSGQTQIKASGGSQVMAFEVNDAERMRIDTSGNLLVGTTSTTVGAGGSGVTGFRVDSANGIVQAAASGSISAILNRTSSDGSIVSLRKDGSEIGIIGAKNGDMYMGTTDAAIRFHDSGDGIRPANASDGSALDDHLDLGAASARFNNLLLVNQPTVGSDISLKQDIEDLSDAEKRVAVKAKGLLKKYKYKNSVRDKGENARIHIGIIAQELQTAFESEGLDAYRYSMFCSDTWTDETTGEEKTQLGVRYSELLAFIIAAI